MPKISRYTVVPKLPDNLKALLDIAYNYYWSWEPEAIALFFRIDRDLWVETNQNPVLMLGRVSQQRLNELAEDDSFLTHLKDVNQRLKEYMNAPAWVSKHISLPENFSVAYLTLEFGIHESLTIYSGGLGLLAGDHLKSASDLGLPLVGVGLLYREGYHTQYLNADGWQQEKYPRNDFYNMAVSQVRDKDNSPVIIEVDYPDGKVMARAWEVKVGRVSLYLLDCDFDANTPNNRELTARLYAGDQNMRIRQEILLGMGAVRLVHALGIYPSVYHMNEGHAAFMTLERIRYMLQERKLVLTQAIEAVKCASCFTTHTPVPAGNDMFDAEMVKYYFRSYCEETGMAMEDLLGLGRQNPRDERELFCMTVLALRLSAHSNGVSKLHGEVARDMWSKTWPKLPVHEVPISSITNGVHTRFWVSRDMATVYDRYIGPNWIVNPSDPDVWKAIDSVPDPELWRTHERRRERLVHFARRRLVTQLKDRGAPQTEISAASEALDPETLTIGFARRFATYKRANLFLMDPDRLLKILQDENKPVQLIIAGKAHPQDSQAKELIRAIIHFIRERNVRSNVVFLENYDINVARYMVQGVDCWLNTPRRPLEASGTSGMKVAVNGGLNISIPDGWWCEAEHLAENGWSIGKGESYDNPDHQNLVESEMLYELLETEIVPSFYDRGRDGVPRRWVSFMKNAIRTICPVFNTHRMVLDYTKHFYAPCTERRNEFHSEQYKHAQDLADWKKHIRATWPKVRITGVQADKTQGLPYGASLNVVCTVDLVDLKKDDVTVEIYYGDLDPLGNVVEGRCVQMTPKGKDDGKGVRFEGDIVCDKTGQQGFTVRVFPSHPDLAEKFEMHLLTWVE